MEQGTTSSFGIGKYLRILQLPSWLHPKTPESALGASTKIGHGRAGGGGWSSVSNGGLRNGGLRRCAASYKNAICPHGINECNGKTLRRCCNGQAGFMACTILLEDGGIAVKPSPGLGHEDKGIGMTSCVKEMHCMKLWPRKIVRLPS